MQRISLCLTALAALIAGCGSTAQHLRSQPAIHFMTTPGTAGIQVPADLAPYVKLHCMRVQDSFASSPGSTGSQECLYVAAEAAPLTAAPDALRDKSISFLMSLSDMNCSNFLHRAFANKAGLDFTKTFTSDLATGVSAGTAHANPAISAALSIGNLLVGKGVDSFNATYYYEKTFQAVKAVIGANRQEIRRQIFARQAKARQNGTAAPYELAEALSDIREYDDACSIMNGLERLVQMAGEEQSRESDLKRNVEVSANPAQRQAELTGTATAPARNASAPGR